MTTMSSRGEIQKQLSCILSVANAQGYKFQEIIPQEMQDHFENLTALTDARTYIKELEAREQILLEQKNELSAKLQVKQAELDDLPEEFKALKVDLQQAQHSIEYYKGLADNSQERADRYQRKLACAEKKQSAAEDESRRIQRLQVELEYQQSINTKLSEEVREVTEHHEILHEQDKAKIATITERVEELLKEKVESEQVADAYDSLIDTLEKESQDVAEAVKRKSLSLRDSDALYAAVSSELEPLDRFFDHALVILKLYQTVFHNLSDPNQPIINNLPEALDDLMDLASEDLTAFQIISDMFQIEGLAQEKVRMHVNKLAKSAANMYNGLDNIKDDLSGFLTRVRSNPDAWLFMKGRFEGTSQRGISALRSRKTVGISHSRGSSISSIANWTSRLAFTSRSEISDNPAT